MNHSIDTEYYTWKKALLWGNFKYHCQMAKKGKLSHRIIHLLIAAIEFPPILSQVASIFEMFIVKNFGITSFQDFPSLSSKKIMKLDKNQSLNPSDFENSSPNSLESEKDKAKVELTHLQKEEIAAEKIKNVFKTYKAKLALKKLKDEKIENKKNISATKIQKIFKGHLGKLEAKKEKEKQKHLLSYDLLEKAKLYIKNLKSLKKFPLGSGKKIIYLIPESSLIIKSIIDSIKAKELILDQKNEAIELCEKSNYSHLVIPQARLCGSYIVETQLPYENPDLKQKMGFYVENQEKLTPAVKEFVNLLCQSNLSDIIGDIKGTYKNFSPSIPLPRYDHFFPYIDKEVGKIGLVDLKGFSSLFVKDKDWCLNRCKKAVNLFPLHYDEIIAEAKKFDPNIENSNPELMEIKNLALNTFKAIYFDHLDYIQKKEVTFENPYQPFKLEPSREEHVRYAAISLLQKENNETSFKNCLGKNEKDVENTLSSFTQAFPKILDSINKFLIISLDMNKKGNQTPISSYNQLAAVRSLNFTQTNYFYLDLLLKISAQLKMESFEGDEKSKVSLVSLIVKKILTEMSGNEIAKFIEFGSPSSQNYFIFY